MNGEWWRMIKVYSSKRDIGIASQLGISNHLYIAGWTLNKVLHNILEGLIYNDEDVFVSLWFDEKTNKPIGICVVIGKYGKYYAMFYVKKQYRKMGVAVSLFTETRKCINRKKITVGFDYGNNASFGFFLSLRNKFNNTRFVCDDVFGALIA